MFIHDKLFRRNRFHPVFKGHAVIIRPDGHVQYVAVLILKRINPFSTVVHAMAAFSGKHPVIICYRFRLRHAFEFQVTGILLPVRFHSQTDQWQRTLPVIIHRERHIAIMLLVEFRQTHNQVPVRRNHLLVHYLATGVKPHSQTQAPHPVPNSHLHPFSSFYCFTLYFLCMNCFPRYHSPHKRHSVAAPS